jgi:valine--pyruvate aminotransferase
MSDDESRSRTEAERLINPLVRGYMESLSLQRFYGGYSILELPPNVLNLGIGEVGNIPLPRDLYALYRRFFAARDLPHLVTRYSGTLGQKETNRRVAAWLNGWLGVERFGPESVVSVDGGQNAAEVAMRAFTTPLGSPGGTRQYVLMATPAYPYFSMVVAAQAGIQAFLAYDGESFTQGVERYCSPAVGVILLNVPNNPMGYELSGAQVSRINRVAAAYDCAIVADVVYAPYALGPAAGKALALLDPERTIFVDSFSKKYGLPGLRLGFALSAVPALTYAMRFIKTAESLTPSSLKLVFAGELLRDQADYPARIAAEVRSRFERFLEAFTRAEAPGVVAFGERRNPFYLPLDISGLVRRTGLTDVEITRYCLDPHQVRVFPGSFVYPGTELKHADFQNAGRAAAGPLPFRPPEFAAGASIVYAPDAVSGRVPLLRLSFGAETRVEQAAQALARAFQELWEGKRM